jgi:hypothetical protein
VRDARGGVGAREGSGEVGALLFAEGGEEGVWHGAVEGLVRGSEGEREVGPGDVLVGFTEVVEALGVPHAVDDDLAGHGGEQERMVKSR